MRAVKISIVVPAFNEERLLGESLAQIKSAARAFAPRGWDFELIVCDNNSTDRTAEIARVAGATVVFEPVNQIARARNSGAAAAFFRTARKFRYSISCCFISVRGTMASMRPRSRRNSAV